MGENNVDATASTGSWLEHEEKRIKSALEMEEKRLAAIADQTRALRESTAEHREIEEKRLASDADSRKAALARDDERLAIYRENTVVYLENKRLNERMVVAAERQADELSNIAEAIRSLRKA